MHIAVCSVVLQFAVCILQFAYCSSPTKSTFSNATKFSCQLNLVFDLVGFLLNLVA